MTDLFNQLQEKMDALMMSTNKYPIKIKVTSNVSNYIIAKCPYEVTCTKDDSPRGYTSSIFGMPLEIDNTIDDDYKFIYEEEEN